MAHVFIKSMVKRGNSFVVELSGCRLGCSSIMPECMYGCISNVGRKMSVDDLLNEVSKQECTNIEVVGSLAQKKEFLKQIAKIKFPDMVPK